MTHPAAPPEPPPVLLSETSRIWHAIRAWAYGANAADCQEKSYLVNDAIRAYAAEAVRAAIAARPVATIPNEEIEKLIESEWTYYAYVAQNSVVEKSRAARYCRAVVRQILRRTTLAAPPTAEPVAWVSPRAYGFPEPGVKVCCTDFEKCREMCMPRADYWQGQATQARAALAEPPITQAASEEEP